ncbi:hypothetical protein SARC_07326 [Sphaeroforma arctica JP610]|uniref:Uncharacterized protein n=1 Tax=Sphaeroforma arctica JP610 TaxID=667725 RepID=A0A0L0FWI2_9EUKA|nr:hypothetical protein SARC_07326 [Sphaeroforma arctica JP610]KNC80313.1 hypothetical protein SARC_07326 [Sphaeroforma arctica JP610]|eukprot:XP_014154215.1 hypothetical protein SARC_07326 [Sphaeroforma arctica JP610]
MSVSEEPETLSNILKKGEVPADQPIQNDDGSLNLANQQALVHCGRCSSYFMACACEMDGHGIDSVITGAPDPRVDAKPIELLRRWASLMVLIPTLYQFDSKAYVEEDGPALSKALEESGSKVVEMTEAYIKMNHPVTDQIAKMFESWKLPLSEAPKQAVHDELRASTRAFIKGDFACVTKIGRVMINNAFQMCDQSKYSMNDLKLQVMFVVLNVLDQVMSIEFTAPYQFLSMEAYRSESVIAKQFWDKYTSEET